jgi:Carboxypeptidase regulatory-like domain
MRRLFRLSAWQVCRLAAIAAVLSVPWSGDAAHAQGVTTGVVTGVVKDVQGQPVAGAGVTAIHLPSGTAYETVTRADGRFSIPGMRVGGPYSVTVFQSGTGATCDATAALRYAVRPVSVNSNPEKPAFCTFLARSETFPSGCGTVIASTCTPEQYARAGSRR